MRNAEIIPEGNDLNPSFKVLVSVEVQIVLLKRVIAVDVIAA